MTDDLISQADLADLLGVSMQRVRDLTREGVLARTARGRWSRREAVRAYCHKLREAATGRAAVSLNDTLRAERIRQARAGAEKLEIANAVARKEMVPAADVERAWRATLGDVRAALLAVPSRVGTRVPTLTAHDVREIDAELRAALTTLADRS